MTLYGVATATRGDSYGWLFQGDTGYSKQENCQKTLGSLCPLPQSPLPPQPLLLSTQEGPTQNRKTIYHLPEGHQREFYTKPVRPSCKAGKTSGLPQQRWET